MNAVCNLLKCQYPILQGAMGVICNPELVAAVSNAGGFGLLATAFTQDGEVLRNQIQATKRLTDKPFGANLFAMNPLINEFVEILTEEKVGAVTVSGGSPKHIIPLLRDKGITSFLVVPTVDLAKKAESAGADAIIAEGSESGGMQGFNGSSTMILVPAVSDAVKIPVLAAGGIGDSRGYKAAMALGAQGVQVGTRFIATKECIAHANYKDTIMHSKETGTRLVHLDRFRIRVLHTPLVEKILQGSLNTSEVINSKSVMKSWIKGDIDSGVLPAGEISGLISGVLSAKEIIDEMVSQ